MNNIALFKQYVPLLDETLRQAALTSDLDGAAELVREGANANELVIQKMSVDGLGDYDRNNGYTNGDVTLTNETVACNFDRGRSFTVDNLDDAETAGIAFGRLAGVFIKDKVVPELDAFRLSTYASTEGIGSASGALTTGAQVITALRAATAAMDDAEVPYENRFLYITPTCKGLIDDLDTTKSRAVMDRFAKVIVVPQTRMYSAITQYDGKTDGQTAGGYVKAAGAVNLNFIVVQKDVAIQYQKHVAPKVISPEMNQNADAWKFGYRNVGICDTYENKVACIYAHKAEA